jgi:hypothetical protein
MPCVDHDLTTSLAESMKRIQTYIDEEYDITQEDEAIQDLAKLLTESLHIE